LQKTFPFGPALWAILICAVGWWLFVGTTILPRNMHVKLTLYVDTPEGERVGSSVSEIKAVFRDGPLREINQTFLDVTHGEATVVDLGARGVLFSTLRGYQSGGGVYWDEYFRMVQAAFPNRITNSPPYEGNANTAKYFDDLNARKPKADLDFGDLPILVRFRDIGAPLSIARVDPNDLAANFGSGVRLKRATLEIVDAPVTEQVAQILPILRHPAGVIFSDPMKFNDYTRPETLLNQMAFKMGW
jgi:hypothetical protein